MLLTAGDAACSIFDLDVTDENKHHALTRLRKTGLEPVTLVNGDFLVAVAISMAKINKKPWRFRRLPTVLATNSAVENEEHFENISGELYGPSIPPSHTVIFHLTKQIMSKQPVSGVTDTMFFFFEQEVYEIVQQYMQNDILKQQDLAEWMSKDGFWDPAKRKQTKKIRKHGSHYSVVKLEPRDFTWADISHIHQFRVVVKATHSNIYMNGYARKSSTPETLSAKEKTVSLQIYKLKTKFLCEDVFASISTLDFDPIASRDYNRPELNLDDHSGNTQTMIQKLTKLERKVRLVAIDYRGLTTNVDDLHHFSKSTETSSNS